MGKAKRPTVESVEAVALGMFESFQPTGDLVHAVRDRYGVSETLAALAVGDALRAGKLRQQRSDRRGVTYWTWEKCDGGEDDSDDA